MSINEGRPARYSIAALLNSGVQPLPDLGEEEFAGLRRAVGRGPLADPLSVSSDGILLDGHQRARAMLANGRKFVDAADVHIVEKANRDNAYEWAVQLNVTRRHMSVEEKADLARKLQRERHWSQATIARLFGVSRPAVSQWLAKYPDADDGVPMVVDGLDGKRYVTDPPPPREDREPRSPWRPDGYAFKALVKARRLLEAEPLAGLDAFYAAKLAAELEDIIAAAETALTAATTAE